MPKKTHQTFAHIEFDRNVNNGLLMSQSYNLRRYNANKDCREFEHHKCPLAQKMIQLHTISLIKFLSS